MKFSMSSKVLTRHDNKKFVYLPLPQPVIDSIWALAGEHVDKINGKIDKSLFNKLEKRSEIHADQPFHDIAPHISIAYNTTKSDPLQLIAEKLGSCDLDLTFSVTNIKLVPPTMNGSLSLVFTIGFEGESKETMAKLEEILEEPPSRGWHITVGQSFYKANMSQAIFDLQSQKNINITRIDESNSKELNVFECWTLIKKQETYFKETLMPDLESMGYEVGYYRGAKDHVVLPLV